MAEQVAKQPTRPFGDTVTGSGELADEERVKYTGKDYDESTGLYYFNARWYDAGTGRFISEDPARDGMSWYAYVASNPLKYIDPSGLEGQNEVVKEDLIKDPSLKLDYFKFIDQVYGAMDQVPDLLSIQGEEFQTYTPESPDQIEEASERWRQAMVTALEAKQELENELSNLLDNYISITNNPEELQQAEKDLLINGLGFSYGLYTAYTSGDGSTAAEGFAGMADAVTNAIAFKRSMINDQKRIVQSALGNYIEAATTRNNAYRAWLQMEVE